MATKIDINDVVVRIIRNTHGDDSGKQFKVNLKKGQNGIEQADEGEFIHLIDSQGGEFAVFRDAVECLVPAIIHCQYYENRGNRYAPKGGRTFHAHLSESEVYDHCFMPGFETPFVKLFHQQFNQDGMSTRCEIRCIEPYDRPIMVSLSDDGTLAQQ